MLIWPFGCGKRPTAAGIEIPEYWLGPGKLETPDLSASWAGGIGVGGIGVAVGKYAAVGGIGWKGVAVVVAFAGMNNKFGFMPPAAGAGTDASGKLQADNNQREARKRMEIFRRMLSLGQFTR